MNIILSNILSASPCSKWSVAELPLRVGSYILHRCILDIHACMSPAFNGSLAIQHFEHGDALKIFHEILFNFNSGNVPHLEVNCGCLIKSVIICHCSVLMPVPYMHTLSHGYMNTHMHNMYI